MTRPNMSSNYSKNVWSDQRDDSQDEEPTLPRPAELQSTSHSNVDNVTANTSESSVDKIFDVPSTVKIGEGPVAQLDIGKNSLGQASKSENISGDSTLKKKPNYRNLHANSRSVKPAEVDAIAGLQSSSSPVVKDALRDREEFPIQRLPETVPRANETKIPNIFTAELETQSNNTDSLMCTSQTKGAISTGNNSRQGTYTKEKVLGVKGLAVDSENVIGRQPVLDHAEHISALSGMSSNDVDRGRVSILTSLNSSGSQHNAREKSDVFDPSGQAIHGFKRDAQKTSSGEIGKMPLQERDAPTSINLSGSHTKEEAVSDDANRNLVSPTHHATPQNVSTLSNSPNEQAVSIGSGARRRVRNLQPISPKETSLGLSSGPVQSERSTRRKNCKNRSKRQGNASFVQTHENSNERNSPTHASETVMKQVAGFINSEPNNEVNMIAKETERNSSCLPSLLTQLKSDATVFTVPDTSPEVSGQACNTLELTSMDQVLSRPLETRDQPIREGFSGAGAELNVVSKKKKGNAKGCLLQLENLHRSNSSITPIVLAVPEILPGVTSSGQVDNAPELTPTDQLPLEDQAVGQDAKEKPQNKKRRKPRKKKKKKKAPATPSPQQDTVNIPEEASITGPPLGNQPREIAPEQCSDSGLVDRRETSNASTCPVVSLLCGQTTAQPPLTWTERQLSSDLGTSHQRESPVRYRFATPSLHVASTALNISSEIFGPEGVENVRLNFSSFFNLPVPRFSNTTVGQVHLMEFAHNSGDNADFSHPGYQLFAENTLGRAVPQHSDAALQQDHTEQPANYSDGGDFLIRPNNQDKATGG